MTVFVPAKVNLSLAVAGKRGNMHLVDMIVCPMDSLCDEVSFEPSSKKAIEVEFEEGDFPLDTDRFMAFFAEKLERISKRLNVFGKLTIKKNIPLAGGLGGSSAVIVGAIKAMRPFGDGQIDDEFLLSLGSDVPAMYRGGILRVEGIGEKLTPLSYDKKLRFEVVTAEGGSDSKECYALYDALKEDGRLSTFAPPPTTVEEALKAMRNDLTLPATILNPNIKEAIDALSKRYTHVIMSGSGSSVVGITIE